MTCMDGSVVRLTLHQHDPAGGRVNNIFAQHLVGGPSTETRRRR